MNFDGMSPQQAAAAIINEYGDQVFRRDRDGMTDIAAACQHFYERGNDDGILTQLQTEVDTVDPQADVRAFMAAFGLSLPSKPQWPDQQTMDLRVRLVAEEFCEWLRDSGYEGNLWVGKWDYASEVETEIYEWHHESGILEEHEELRSLPKSADALIDLLYVTIGSLLAMGIDMWPLWAEVQRANMAKSVASVKAADERKIKGLSRTEKTKPVGWQPPDIEGALLKQGWEGGPDDL